MALARILIVMLVGSSAFAADEDGVRVNYMLNCQGCHLAQAQGVAGKVPKMKDFVGYFLHSPEGRRFIIRVPGVAYSALDDAEIAALMNWLLRTYSAAQLPGNFSPYNAGEVAVLRENPEQDPETTRAVILGEIAADVPALAAELARDNRQRRR